MRLHRYKFRILCVITALVMSLGTVFTSSAKSVEETIFDFLINRMDFNSAAACGVLANIEKESSFNPNIYGDNGTSYGICQWHASRFTNLKRYCEEHSLDYTSLEGQLEFLNYELSALPKILNYLRSVSDTADGAYDAAYYWCYNFEIPANREQNSKLRGDLARTKYWPIFGGQTVVDNTVPFEIWQVNTDRLKVRTGPGTSYPQTSIWTRDSQIRITDVAFLDSGEIWGKTRLGWSDMSYMSYVSGALFSVSYHTGCASGISQTLVHTGENFVLPAALGLSRHGYSFAGWSVGGKVLSPGSALKINGNITVKGLWERNPSVALIKGDANCDKLINSKDVIITMRYMLGSDVPICHPCADIDGNGRINARDIIMLMRVMLRSVTIEPEVSAEEETMWQEILNTTPEIPAP